MTSQPHELSHDTRWENAMLGLRVRIVYGQQEGEVTGFEHADRGAPNFYVVLDGETEPVRVFWHHLVPA